LIGLGHVVANCRGVAGLPALFATHLADRLMADRVACYGLREDGVHLVAVAGDDDAALGNVPTSELSPEACGLLGIEGGSDGPSGPPTHIGGETHGFSAGLDIYHGSARAAVDSDDGWGGVLIPLMAGGGVVGLFEVWAPNREQPFSDADLALLAVSGMMLGQALGSLADVSGVVDDDPSIRQEFARLALAQRPRERRRDPLEALEPVDLAAPTRLLLVDDDPHLITAVSRYLQRSTDFVVETATSVREAVESALVSRPRVAVLDIDLPDGSGFELLQRLRETITGEMGAIAFTGHSDLELMERAEMAGFDACLVKGAKLAHLVEEIRRCVE